MVNNMAQTKDFFDIKSLPVVYHPGETLDEELQEMDMGIQTGEDYNCRDSGEKQHYPRYGAGF